VRIAITREVSAGIDRCELLHVERESIDVHNARAQHRRYEQTLQELGCTLLKQTQAPDLPDSVFVEDNAVLFDDLAVIARSAARSRRPETAAIETALEPYRELARIDDPGTLDGGDVLSVGRTVFVGASTRTNRDALNQMRVLLEPRGYDVRSVAVDGCLHLKSAVTRIGEDRLLVNRKWLDPSSLRGHELVDVDPTEPFGANTLWVENTLICSTLYPRTRDRLVDRGHRVVEVDLSELAKAEGGVTCCSIVFEATG
jgi:dimethylargininase